jgi:hypothetical protein
MVNIFLDQELLNKSVTFTIFKIIIFKSILTSSYLLKKIEILF